MRGLAISVLIAAASGAGAGVGVAALRQPVYLSEALIQVLSSPVPEVHIGPLATVMTDDVPRLAAAAFSRPRFEAIIREMGLYRETGSTTMMYRAVQQFNQAFRFERIKGDVVRISFIHHDARTAMRVAERLAEDLVQESATEHEYTMVENQDFFDAEVQRVERRLFEVELEIDTARRTAAAVPRSAELLLESLGARYRILKAGGADLAVVADLAERQLMGQLKIIDAARLPEAPLDRKLGMFGAIGAVAGAALFAGVKAARRAA